MRAAGIGILPEVSGSHGTNSNDLSQLVDISAIGLYVGVSDSVRRQWGHRK